MEELPSCAALRSPGPAAQELSFGAALRPAFMLVYVVMRAHDSRYTVTFPVSVCVLYGLCTP